MKGQGPPMETQIIEVCRRLYGRNMLAAADGNVSVRLPTGNILITRSGQSKAFMDINSFAEVTLENQVLRGSPSSERLMHLAVYQHVTAARAVVHAHPPAAIAWTVSNPRDENLPVEFLSELILAVGRVPIVPYTRPGTSEMGSRLLPYLHECRVMLLARHGAVAWGETLEEALWGIERVEHAAQILRDAKMMGGMEPLPADEVAALWALRRQLGQKTL